VSEAWLEFADPETYGRALASHAGRLARQVLGHEPIFRLALSGGSGPLPFFRHLTDPGLFPAALWSRTHVFFVDERMVPGNHPDSNFAAAQKHLFSRLPLPQDNIHRMNGELSPQTAARQYARTLAEHFRPAPGQIPAFDLVMLGMGADGHTASLFPAAALQPEQTLVWPVPPPQARPSVARLTLTEQVLSAAREAIFHVLGADKHRALRLILAGDRTLPAARICARRQSWYVCPALTDNNPPSKGRLHGRF
jgi:6-phosphogluconolactonase